ncbi:lipid A biosynthesis acyltransferase [Henriciella sp.]|uniref:LpxL/LpxP family acyltransferase n=1 Tax=Henriciella sp. TaxID=1968823 RepID=UPI002616883F|nr:lipid A biosynthesis acyltransferase [Henriciella sp.]
MESWSKQAERGTYSGILLSAWIYKLLGRRITLALLAPVVGFFYLSGHKQRRASRDYLERAWRDGLLKKRPGVSTGFSHFMAFAGSMLDKVASWTGKIRPEQIEGVNEGLFDEAKRSGRGGVVLTAHIGNPELIRGVATVNRRFPVTVLVHTQNAENFNAVINRFSADSTVRVVQVEEIDISIAMKLSEAVENGEWVVLTADRSPPGELRESAMLPVRFLGDTARFPAGPFILASALKCPTYFLACVRRKGKPPFRIDFRLLADPVTLPRRDREAAIKTYMELYAEMLRDVLVEAPLQWFNFFDYWGKAGSSQNAHADTATADKTEHQA